MLIQSHQVMLDTPDGPMGVTVIRPVDAGRFPSVIFYSEIFQLTAPIIRSAQIMASHGFVVLLPEIFHQLNPPGTVLAYDDEGKDKGNADKFAKSLHSHDRDTEALVGFIRQQDYCCKKIGAMGVCIGGHLAFRAALNSNVSSAFCLYPTDLHSHTLSAEDGQDSLSLSAQSQAEFFLVFGQQDPHVPIAGRQKIYQQLQQQQVNFSWLEVNAQHAFMRDEGERYDAALALSCYQQAVAFFQRTLR